MSETRFVFWDVQHGSAAYIRTPNGKHIVIDLGTGSYEGKTPFSPLLYLKYKHNVQLLDAVIITHPHRDHLDDIFNFDTLSPKAFCRPVHLSETDVRRGNQSRDSAVIDKYLEINRRYTGSLASASNPFLPNNNGGVVIQPFIPTGCARSNLNNHSLVTIISYGGVKIIIPGDNEEPSWNELLEREDFRAAIQGTHVLVASHHGRESGFSPALFNHISPYLTIISDGPAKETSVSDRYAQRTQGWRVYKRRNGTIETRKCLTTRNDGAIVVRFGENKTLDVSIN